MFEIPISSAANTFVWGFVLLIAYVGAVMAVDVIKSSKEDKVEPKEKRLL